MIEYVVYDTKEHVVVEEYPDKTQASQASSRRNECAGEPKRFLVFEYNRGGA